MPPIDWHVISSGLLYALVTGVFNLLFSHKSQIADWAEQNPRLAAVMKLTRALGLDPWALIAAFQLAITKRLPDAQKNIDNSKKGPPSGGVDVTANIGPRPRPDNTDVNTPPAAIRAWHLAFGAALVMSCNPLHPPCDESKLRAIDAEYLEAVGTQCLQYASAASCPALPALRAKHSAALHEACH